MHRFRLIQLVSRITVSRSLQLVACLALAPVCAGQGTERASVDSLGVQGNDFSFHPSISADGRYVAFESAATNLVAGDTNDSDDVFVHDRQSGTTERASIDTGGVQGNGDSEYSSISADGRHVTLVSDASNLVAGDTNDTSDVFVHDCQSSTTERISVATGGAQGNGDSFYPSISADGRYVAFLSEASNLVVGDTNGAHDVFVHDRQGGATERVSVDSAGAQGNASSLYASLSADGRRVAFQSDATNLVAGDTNGWPDVFVHDRESGTTERASVATGGAQGNGYSLYPSISADGRCVAFESYAANLVADDTNDGRDVFVFDDESIGQKYCTANSNSTGAPADISASGSASSAAGSLVLTSAPVPNQSGVFFHGASPTQNVFGNGFMCATGGITRGAVTFATGNLASYTYDNSDAKHSLSAFIGTTRNIQHWFRDPLGGGALFNLSNAIAIAILP